MNHTLVKALQNEKKAKVMRDDDKVLVCGLLDLNGKDGGKTQIRRGAEK